MKFSKYFLSLLSTSLVLASPALAEKYAVLIGIEDYSRVGASNLPGCLKDVEDVQSLLTSKFGFPSANISVLKDSQATQANVLTSLEDLVSKAKPNDSVVIYYSGHGAQVPDMDGDEKDGKDEALIGYDFSQRNPKTWILDDHLRHALGRIKTNKTLVLIDSCHSGTGTRDITDPEKVTKHVEFGFKNMLSPGVVEKADQDGKAPESHVLISGCSATELSGMGRYDGVRRSLFTTALINILPRMGTTDLASLQTSLHQEMTRIDAATAAKQHPQVETSMNVTINVLLGDAPAPAPNPSPSPAPSPSPSPAPSPNQPAPSLEIPSAFRVELVANKEVFKPEETMEAMVTSAQAGYLRLYYINKDGDAKLIFPNNWQQDNKIDGQKKITVGGADSQFLFRMKAPEGMEMLLAAVSPTQFTDADAFRFTPDKPFADMGKATSIRGLLDTGVKEVVIEANKPPRPAQIGRAAFIYSISQQ